MSKMRIYLGKKGVESYISWVILIALAVTTSVFVYTWSITNVEKSFEYIEESENKGTCADVGINVNDMCQNAQTLNINISNIKMQGVSGLKFQFFDIYDNTESRVKNVSIRPKEIKNIEIIKQGTLKQVEIVPITIYGNKIIMCTRSVITIENIRIC